MFIDYYCQRVRHLNSDRPYIVNPGSGPWSRAVVLGSGWDGSENPDTELRVTRPLIKRKRAAAQLWNRAHRVRKFGSAHSPFSLTAPPSFDSLRACLISPAPPLQNLKSATHEAGFGHIPVAAGDLDIQVVVAARDRDIHVVVAAGDCESQAVTPQGKHSL